MFLLSSDLSTSTLKLESLSSFKSKLIDILLNIYFYLRHKQDKLSITKKVELTTTTSKTIYFWHGVKVLWWFPTASEGISATEGLFAIGMMRSFGKNYKNPSGVFKAIVTVNASRLLISANLRSYPEIMALYNVKMGQWNNYKSSENH